MSDRVRCTCRSCTIRSLMGPAVLTTIGVLFLLGEFVRGGYFSIWNTFPVVFIVIGGILLASSLAPTEGHVDSSLPQAPRPAVPPSSYQGPSQGQGQ